MGTPVLVDDGSNFGWAMCARPVVARPGDGPARERAPGQGLSGHRSPRTPTGTPTYSHLPHTWLSLQP